VALVFAILVTSSTALLWVLLGFSLVLGSSSCSHRRATCRAHLAAELVHRVAVAARASPQQQLLIVAGTLVGASGMLLTRMMSSAMGRSLPNILFSAFGSW